MFRRVERPVHTLISDYNVDFIMIFKNSKLKMYANLSLDFVITCIHMSHYVWVQNLGEQIFSAENTSKTSDLEVGLALRSRDVT